MYPLNENATIDFGESIYGFEQLSLFRFEATAPDSSFYLLKSLEDENIGFIVISPFEVDSNYEFKLSEESIKDLRVEKAEDVLVLSIVTILKPFERSTTNLLAPLVINIKEGIGRQVVLSGVSYTVNSPLLSNGNEGDI
ncbi:flagellar assembly protein FliW [Paenibacillus harenae]|uniref:flagellar assembly protein FliW n=1 Tax=Paenibacillus harenae TaxID=306543 RepID=UPI00278F69F4|nr:flagellar assembly protein FliW [Paenibacillus harenae]MDQ0062038.1 flagellar assembly factor FliW [Paenibacillus harenae]